MGIDMHVYTRRVYIYTYIYIHIFIYLFIYLFQSSDMSRDLQQGRVTESNSGSGQNGGSAIGSRRRVDSGESVRDPQLNW